MYNVLIVRNNSTKFEQTEILFIFHICANFDSKFKAKMHKYSIYQLCSYHRMYYKINPPQFNYPLELNKPAIHERIDKNKINKNLKKKYKCMSLIN